MRVDDFQVAPLDLPEKVPRGQPVLIGFGGFHAGVSRLTLGGKITRDVGAGDLELSVLAEAHGHPWQGAAHRVFHVIAGRGHGQPAGALGHAEAAAQGHLVAMGEKRNTLGSR